MANELVNCLIECGCIDFFQEEPFQYASGTVGPIYCDNRKILGFPRERNIFVNSLISLIEKTNIEFDLIAGMATGGVPIAAIIADRLNLPFCYVRSSAKGHGKAQLVEGKYDQGMKVILIEDLINQGGSVNKGAQTVLQSGLNLQGIFSLVNYSFSTAEDLLKDYNCPVLSLVCFNDLKQHILESDNLSTNLLEHLQDWHKDPKNWKFHK